MSILEVKNLSIQFGGLRAVDDFNLSLEKGELVAVIGPNGAGKTTIFNMLTGIYRPTAGSIELEGESLVGLKPYQFAQRGITRTFQNIRLFANASVADNVKMAATMHGTDHLARCLLRTRKMGEHERELDETVMSLLERLNMADKADLLAKNLPYGDQRRLEIARALMTDPKILLLDEPVAGMITTELEEMAQLVAKIRKDFNLSIIMIEHHMNFVMPIADRIKVVDFGKTISEGTPDVVQKDPKVIEAYLGGGYQNVEVRRGNDESSDIRRDHAPPESTGNDAAADRSLSGSHLRRRRGQRGRVARELRHGRRLSDGPAR